MSGFKRHKLNNLEVHFALELSGCFQGASDAYVSCVCIRDERKQK